MDEEIGTNNAKLIKISDQWINYEIPKDTILGMTHVKVRKMIIRTPLGGLYNHSNKPNCVKFQPSNDKSMFFLTSLKDIKKGEEITVQYTLYSMKD